MQGKDLITPQQAKWLEARGQGLSPVEAAKVAGYKDPHNAAFRLTRNQTLLFINHTVGAMHGVDLVSIFETIGRNMNAKKLIVAKFKGEITDQMEVDDGDLQLRAATLAADLLGVKPAEEHKLVKDEEETQSFLVPDNFRDLSPEDALTALQKRRQALVSGVAMPSMMAATDGNVSDDDEE